MYEKQFQFRSRPFCSIPAADHYFPASSIDNALETVKMCVERASGPAVVFGQTGWGKSLLLAVLQREFKPQFRVVNIVACTRMSRRHDLLQNILFELGQPYREMSEGELRLALIDYLKPSAQCPNGILLLVDDGHSLPTRLLDELRMITNFVRDGQPRVRLVIAGTQQLEEKLTHPQLESLNQRIAARCYLQCLRRDEIEAYIRHHVLRAGRGEQNVFLDTAIKAVSQLCDGNPRTINQVCDHSLILAASCGQATVTGEIIAEAFSDIQQLPASLWTPTDEPKPFPSQEKTDGSWSVVEFGKIDEAPQVASQTTLHDDSDTYELSEVAAADSNSDTVDEFSQMVDSLAHFYASAADSESVPSAESPTALDDDEFQSELMTHDPFAETFAEEYSVQDNYAQLAARQNRASTQITDHELTRLGEQIKEMQSDIERVASVTPIAPSIHSDPLRFETIETSSGFVQSSDPSAGAFSLQSFAPYDLDTAPSELGATTVVEYPITHHHSYRLASDDPSATTQRSAAKPNKDDRDMLVVSQANPSASQRSRVAPLDLGGTSVSRGQAIRVEYTQLFQQLRGGETSQ